jgi:hypothetical protein
MNRGFLHFLHLSYELQRSQRNQAIRQLSVLDNVSFDVPERATDEFEMDRDPLIGGCRLVATVIDIHPARSAVRVSLEIRLREVLYDRLNLFGISRP